MSIVVCAALVGADTAPASGPLWSAPIALQPNVNAFGAVLAVGGGHTLAAWEGNTGVWAAVSAASGGFKKQRLSPVHTANVITSLLEANARGDAVAAWETRALPRPTGHGLPPGALYVDYRRAGERFARPQRIAERTEGAVLGIDRRGDVWILWRQLARGHLPAGVYLMRHGRDGHDGPVRRVLSGRVLSFALLVNASGDLGLVWEQGGLASPALMCETASTGSGFGPALTLVSAQQGAGPFDAEIDSSGALTIAWEGPYDGATSGMPYQAVNVTTLNASGTAIAATQQLGDQLGGQLGDDGIRLVVNGRGDAIAVWDVYPSRTGAGERLVVSRRSGGAPFAPARELGPTDIAGGFDAAIAPTGAGVVTWQSNYRIKAALTRGPTEPLQKPSTISAIGQASAAPTAAITPNGKARVLWQGLGPDQPRHGQPNSSPLLLAASSRP